MNRRRVSFILGSTLWLGMSSSSGGVYMAEAAASEPIRVKEHKNCHQRRQFGVVVPSTRTTAPLLALRGGAVQMVGTIDQIETILNDSSSISPDDDGNNNTNLVVIYFTSNNCPPCTMIGPIYDDLSHSEEFVERGVQFLKVNVSDHPEVATRFNVDGWPTFLLFKGGEKRVDEIVGGNAAKVGLYDMVNKYA